MQSFSDLRTWLSNGISENPLMLHGTGIESVFELANSGKLPTGVINIDEESVYEADEGRLFFAPVSSRFKGEKYKELFEIGKSKCIRDARSYASYAAFTNFLASELGCKTAETYTLLGYLECGSIGWKELERGLRKDGIRVSIERMKSLYAQARKRKGVIVEPTEAILELPNEVDEDDVCAIAVECPEGLDKKYIHGIELLGRVEKGLMRRFLDGKLDYKGFKTEKPLFY
jgi:hypothetical protein